MLFANPCEAMCLKKMFPHVETHYKNKKEILALIAIFQ